MKNTIGILLVGSIAMLSVPFSAQAIDPGKLMRKANKQSASKRIMRLRVKRVNRYSNWQNQRVRKSWFVSKTIKRQQIRKNNGYRRLDLRDVRRGTFHKSRRSPYHTKRNKYYKRKYDGRR